MTTVTDKTAATGNRNPRTGIERVRDTDAWRTSTIMAEAAYEANRLCEQISRAIQDAYFSRDELDPYAADVATCSDTRDKAYEARTLLQMALDHLNTLTGYSRQEPPW
jgi:hypothetical protein